jgi:hypothetical protein
MPCLPAKVFTTREPIDKARWQVINPLLDWLLDTSVAGRLTHTLAATVARVAGLLP